MPRKAVVSVEEAVQCVKNFIFHFSTSEMPNYAATVWKDMTIHLNNKWKQHNLYNNVVQDRRSILTLARQEKGVIIPLSAEVSNTRSYNTSESSSESEDDFDLYLNGKNTPEKGQQLFKVQLTKEEWDAIRPLNLPESKKPTLQKGVWNNVVPISISRQTKIPCAYVFKRAKVSETTTGMCNFVTIWGQCRSNSCKNKIKAYIEEEPADKDSVILQVLTQDTRNDVTHEVVKRPLNGKYRKDVQKELVHEGASNFRKRKAREEMVLGDKEPPHLPNATVLRQAKKQHVDNNLGIDLVSKKDLNASIEALSEQAEFIGKIEYIASRPFMVVYRTPSQLHAYKEYCKQNINSTVMIDATGSLVKKINRNNKARCGPIFLYSMVVNFDNITIPVHQMLSERHDAHSIMTWIHLFLRAGAPKPKLSICDFSKALLYAMCREFNETSLKKYTQECFVKLKTKQHIHFDTHLRVDVAHILHAVSRWKCWKSVTHIEVKQFFLRCVALMIQASDLEHFKNLLISTFAVAGQKYLDSTVEFPVKHNKAGKEVSSKISVLEIRHNLETLMTKTGIALRKFGIDTTADSEHLRPVDNLSQYVKCESDGSRIKCVADWVDDILTTSSSTEIEGREMNAFYIPAFIPLMKTLAVDFPLWTNCTTPNMNANASSAAIEGYFNDLKTNVMRKGLRRADHFLVTHLRDIEGGSLLFVANTARHRNEETQDNDTTVREKEVTCEEDNLQNVSCYYEVNSQTTQHDPDLWSVEDWGGQVPQSEFVTGVTSISRNGVDESEEEGILEITDVWDHSYCRDLKLLYTMKEPRNEVPRTNKKLSVDLTKKSTYFGELAEIRLINARLDNKRGTSRKYKKTCFLENGSKLTHPVKIKNKTYFVQSTCPFDSLSQVLLSAAIDHPLYDAVMKKSRNTMLQFITETLATGVIRKTYTDRARLLLNWYDPQPNVQTENKILSYTLNGYDSIFNFVHKALRTEPSVHTTEECSQQCKQKYTSVLMSPNHRIITKLGFSALEKALNFWPLLKKLKCFTKDCNGLMTRVNQPGIHLFIDADVRENPNDKRGMRCKLSDIPISLEFKDVDGNDMQYRLIGAINYTPGHFSGYSFRNTGNWEHYDDMEINKTFQSAATEIEPHLIMYVRLQECDLFQIA